MAIVSVEKEKGRKCGGAGYIYSSVITSRVSMVFFLNGVYK